MQYLEKDFQMAFSKYAKNKLRGSAAYELKLARGASLPFSALQEHQVNALRLSKHQRIFHKIPDLGMQNPFDCFVLEGVAAFIAVQYIDTRQQHRPKEFVLIDIDVWLAEEKSSTRRSLTRSRAAEIGTIHTFA